MSIRGVRLALVAVVLVGVVGDRGLRLHGRPRQRLR